jgi:hypothetical protein
MPAMTYQAGGMIRYQCYLVKDLGIHVLGYIMLLECCVNIWKFKTVCSSVKILLCTNSSWPTGVWSLRGAGAKCTSSCKIMWLCLNFQSFNYHLPFTLVLPQYHMDEWTPPFQIHNYFGSGDSFIRFGREGNYTMSSQPPTRLKAPCPWSVQLQNQFEQGFKSTQIGSRCPQGSPWWAVECSLSTYLDSCSDQQQVQITVPGIRIHGISCLLELKLDSWWPSLNALHPNRTLVLLHPCTCYHLFTAISMI